MSVWIPSPYYFAREWPYVDQWEPVGGVFSAKDYVSLILTELLNRYDVRQSDSGVDLNIAKRVVETKAKEFWNRQSNADFQSRLTLAQYVFHLVGVRASTALKGQEGPFSLLSELLVNNRSTNFRPTDNQERYKERIKDEDLYYNRDQPSQPFRSSPTEMTEAGPPEFPRREDGPAPDTLTDEEVRTILQEEIQNVLVGIMENADSTVDGVNREYDRLSDVLTDLVEDIASGDTTRRRNLDKLQADLEGAVEDNVGGVLDLLNGVYNETIDAIGDLAGDVSGRLTRLRDDIIGGLSATFDGIVLTLTELLSPLTAMVGGVLEWMTSFWDMLLEFLKTLWSMVEEWVKSALAPNASDLVNMALFWGDIIDQMAKSKAEPVYEPRS